MLERDWGVGADLWSCPSFTELRRDGLAAERWNLLHPADKAKKSHVETCLEKHAGPVIVSTDYMKAFGDGIRAFLPRDPGDSRAIGKVRNCKVLGTDGFGRSDTREKLRHFFEVNRFFVTIAALKALAEDGAIEAKVVADAIKKYGIDPAKSDPTTV